MRDDRYLPPRVLQIVGLVLLLAFAFFWGATGRESVLLVGAAGSLILLGRYEDVRRALSRWDVEPSPPPIAPAQEEEEKEKVP